MPTRAYPQHITSLTEPTSPQQGDEWFNPSTNILSKYVITNGVTPGWQTSVIANANGTITTVGAFSGVVASGAAADIAVFLVPKGNSGYLSAAIPDNTIIGGNARGAKSVDWQQNRYGPQSVASGSLSVIGGGDGNMANGYAATIAGGTNNQSTFNWCAVGGGSANVSSGQYAVVGGGQGNTSTAFTTTVGGGFGNNATGYSATISGGTVNQNSAAHSAMCGGISNNISGWYSFIGGGNSNVLGGYYNIIGGGQSNSGTANAAVTTQSSTMNGTTAVTLSGSNANIKVGQYITGTSIATDTYVAAISGTSLTLSKVASGSSTSTLSFYTPHGIVVGGGNNQATGAYSFIGGGGDAGTAANRNTASGDWSVVGGGYGNIASGTGSFIGGGGIQLNFTTGNTASGASSSIAGGLGNSASGSGAAVSGGYQNIASGVMSSVVGGRRGTTRGINGNIVSPACNIPIFDANGVSQSAILVLGRETTNATPTVLCSDSVAAGTANQIILPNNSAYYFRGTVVAGVTGGGNTKGWFIEGVIKRGANAAATALVGTATVTSSYADAGASAWAIAVTADTTNGGLAVTFTGQASTTIRCVAKIETTEMTY